MPYCRKVGGHDWHEGSQSRWCTKCWLVQALPRPKWHPQVRHPRWTPEADRRRARAVEGTPSNKDLVFIRDGPRCRYCGVECDEDAWPGHPRRLTYDHVWPRSKGGSNSVENLVVACARCNWAKGDSTDFPSPNPLPA